MKFQPIFKIGATVRNKDIMDQFGCSGMGGMRKSNKTNTLVIVSDKTKNLYEDRWDGDTLHYTGMGQKGDQSLTYMQNRTLAESRVNEVEVFLFEVYKLGEYFFWGPVDLVGDPYQEFQKGDDGKLRKVWMFPIQPRDKSAAIPAEVLIPNEERKERNAKKLSPEELRDKAQRSGTGKPTNRRVASSTYIRNVHVSVYAKQRANGVCTLCEQPAPFKTKQGEPYLETHHIQWLAEGGADAIDNTVALCPNCHRKMHVVKSKKDIEKLKESIKSRDV